MLAGVESNAWREEVTLRAEFEAGAIAAYDDYQPWILDRFRSGSRVRGFEPNGLGPRDVDSPNQDALGGNYYWAARAEAQFPIGFPEEYGIQGGLFADVGSLWGLDNTDGSGPCGGRRRHVCPRLGRGLDLLDDADRSAALQLLAAAAQGRL